MADYTYRISASGTATGADAGFTTINAAVSDFVGNNRMGAGTGIVAASSTLYFKIDGFLAIDALISGIDTTTNSGAAIVVESWSNAWNASVGRIGYQTSFDGLDLGGFNQAVFGTSGARQANLTVRNLVFRGSGAGYTSPIVANGPTTGAISVLLENLFICCNHGSQAEGPALDAASMRNSVVFFPNGGGDGLICSGRANAVEIEQCSFVALAAMQRFVNNQNDPMPLVKNSYVGLATATFVNSGTWSTSCTGNATDQASGATNWTSTVTSVAVSTTNFENVTSGTEDFRVKAGSALATTGATRLASTLTDVFAVSRQDPTTIGAHEALGGAPTISAPTATATGTGTTATVGVTTDTNTGTLYALARVGGSAASAATIKSTGQSASISTTSPSFSYAGLTANTAGYVVDFVQNDGTNDSNVVSSAAFSTDLTSPSLTSASASSAAPLTCQGSVSTNEATGTLYTVFTASATAPSAAQVKAGQDHTGSAALRAVSQAVSGTGTQSIASGAVTAGTRYMHCMHEDAATNQSTVASSASFTVVGAATSMTISLKQSDGTTAAASITGIEYLVLDADTLWAATAILDSGTGESTDGSGNLVLDITGLGLFAGDVRYVIAGKSDGTVGADFDGWQGPATAA